MTTADRVRRAEPADARHIAGLLAAAFMDDPVSRWLFPDAEDRARRYRAFFQVFTDRALRAGQAHLTADGHAAALWLRTGTNGAAPPIPEQPLADACGPHLRRMQILDELVEAGHPADQHEYLSYLGVRPGQQGGGRGSALMRHRIAALDAAGMPAYLEATTPRNHRLYQRLGFTALPGTIDLPDGPCLVRMWRPDLGGLRDR